MEHFFCQELLPGWLWAPMDTATELPELPFRPWNTSVPICGLLNPFLYHTNTNILMLCYMITQVFGIQILHRCAAKKVKHFVLWQLIKGWRDPIMMSSWITIALVSISDRDQNVKRKWILDTAHHCKTCEDEHTLLWRHTQYITALYFCVLWMLEI